jgi:hypothetical protein
MQNPYAITKIDVKSGYTTQAIGARDGVLPEHPFRMYIIGSSGSGKTNFMLNLLKKKTMYAGYFHSVLVLSPTARSLDRTYQTLDLPDSSYYPCDEHVLETIRDIQEERKHDGIDSRVLVILDDVVSFKSFCSSDILLQFAVMSRHWNISMMILSQAYHRIPKAIRLQMTSIVYFKGSNRELETLAEDFGAPGMSKREFTRVIQQATDVRYSFFFVDLHRPLESRYRRNLTEHVINQTRDNAKALREDKATDDTRIE